MLSAPSSLSVFMQRALLALCGGCQQVSGFSAPWCVCRLLELPGPHYVLFTADPDPTTGVSWCPDCVRCSPAVKNVMADKKASLLEVLVGQRPVWKDPQHPLR